MDKILDLENWDRKATYDLFKDFDDPFFNITANVDVTELYLHCKKSDDSFFLSTLFCSTKVCNEIENFKLRKQDGNVIILEKNHCGSAVFHKENNTFSYCYFTFYENRQEFLSKGKITLEEHLKNPYFDARHDEFDLIYHSVIPWVHFTQFKHARQQRKDDSIPRITFGGVKETSPGKFEMPVSVEVNHALCDGFHVGLWFEKFAVSVQSL